MVEPEILKKYPTIAAELMQRKGQVLAEVNRRIPGILKELEKIKAQQGVKKDG